MRRNRRQRKLASSTAALYSRTLERFYGAKTPDYVPDLENPAPVPETVRAILCAALVHYWTVRRESDKGEALAAEVPEGPYVERVKIFPSIEEIERFEAAVPKLPERVAPVVRVTLALGLRGEEVLSLTRAAFMRALVSGRIAVLGKGNKERELPTAKAKKAILALLAARPRDGEPWEVVGELLGSRQSSFSSRRNMFSRYVKRAAFLAGLTDNANSEGWSPHRLRHIFSTRMAMAGAPDVVVAAALGHSGGVTHRYIHITADQILQYMRET